MVLVDGGKCLVRQCLLPACTLNQRAPDIADAADVLAEERNQKFGIFFLLFRGYDRAVQRLPADKHSVRVTRPEQTILRAIALIDAAHSSPHGPSARSLDVEVDFKGHPIQVHPGDVVFPAELVSRLLQRIGVQIGGNDVPLCSQTEKRAYLASPNVGIVVSFANLVGQVASRARV